MLKDGQVVKQDNQVIRLCVEMNLVHINVISQELNVMNDQIES